MSDPLESLWRTVVFVYDQQSEKWALKGECIFCHEANISEPMKDEAFLSIMRGIGICSVIDQVCDRCNKIVGRIIDARSSKAKITTPAPAPAPVSKKDELPPPNPCRNHLEFRDNCMACLNQNYRKKF